MGKRNIIILILSAIGLIFTASVLNGMYDKQVRQKVSENPFGMDMAISLSYKASQVMIYSRKPDGNLDSNLVDEGKRFEEMMKSFTRPYRLITTYNHHTIEDYGTFREIDSLKCIRYHEMVNKRAMFDSIDVVQEVAEQKAIDDAKNKLEQLNKSCN